MKYLLISFGILVAISPVIIGKMEPYIDNDNEANIYFNTNDISTFFIQLSIAILIGAFLGWFLWKIRVNTSKII